MAKKRLNKKVVLIGLAVFVLIVFAGIIVILRLSQDPQKFIQDGDAALAAARAATDQDIKEQQYERVQRNYLKARSIAKTDSLRVEILFKLVDMNIEIEKWRNTLGCWDAIIRIDSKNVKARFGQLKYFYIVADGGVFGVWQEVESRASELIEVAEEAELLGEDTSQFESFEIEGVELAGQRLGPYLYVMRGRAILEMTRMGAVTDPDESLGRAVEDLEKARELEPSNAQVYWYLAQATLTKGDILASRGNLEERDKTREQARELLEEAVKVAGDDPQAYINLLVTKPMLAEMAGVEQIQSLEPEYLSLVEKFDSDAEVYSALSGFYRQLGYKSLDKAIEAIEKAIELDSTNVVYAINAANFYYQKFSIYGEKDALYKSIELARGALAFPAAQDESGPRQRAKRRNRATLYVFLANCYIEQILEPCEVRTDLERQGWLEDAEEAVRGIEQLFGSGEDPRVLNWRGRLELAKGNKETAVRQLYAAYERLKAPRPARPPWPRDPQFAQLSYVLAKVFRDSSEIGAVTGFLTSAVYSGIVATKPEVLLDYADVLLEQRLYGEVLSIVKSFEERYWSNDRTRILRAKAYIDAKQFDEAEQELARREDQDSAATIKLKLALTKARMEQVQRAIAQREAEEGLEGISQGLLGPESEEAGQQTSGELMATELAGYSELAGGLLEKLLKTEPNSVDDASVITVCNNYITSGKTGKAEALVNLFLGYHPDNTGVQFYRLALLEPDLLKISAQRRREIEERVLSDIADPDQRSLKLGLFYKRDNKPDKASVEFRRVLNEVLQKRPAEEPALGQGKAMTDSERLATEHLFELALEGEDWALGEQISKVARRDNIDECEGNLFAGRLAMAKEDYKDALARLDECLKQRPVFSRGFMYRSNINTVLGNEHAAIEDAQKAASLNPLNGGIARVLALTLYQRNEKLGGNASSEQTIEARKALDRAIALNTGYARLQLLSLYAEYISPTEPLRALAIRQRLQKVAPSLENAWLLGRMALKVGLAEADAKRRELLFSTASSSFDQALAIDPENKAVIETYAEYYRLTNQQEKAENLLGKVQDKKLLWGHYFRSGQFDDARAVLEQQYNSGLKDSDVVKGLLLVAQKTGDKEGVRGYSEELLSLEESMENRLFQIRQFLGVGLVREAEYKLQSFQEKYPDEPRGQLLEAWLAMKKGQLKRALDLTNRTLETNQESAVNWQLRGEINLLIANYNQAIIDLKRSHSLLEEPVVRVSLAKAYMRAGRHEDAITELKNTIDDPQAPNEARTLLEEIYRQLGRKDALKRFYKETVSRFPDRVYWYNKWGVFAINEGEFAVAEEVFKQGWQRSKQGGAGNAVALDGYLQALLLGGKLDKVFEVGRECIDGDFAPIAFIRMAEAKLKLGDRTSAVDYCHKAVTKAGTNSAVISDMLQRMQLLVGAEEALRFCSGRVESEPDSIAANLGMFVRGRINGEYNNALRYIDRCIEIAGSDGADRFEYIYKKAGVLLRAYTKTSDNSYLKRAIREYESLLAQMPNSTNILNNFAYILAENDERLSEALEYARRAWEARPNDPSLLDTYSYVLYKNGKYLEASEFLQAALQQYELNEISVPAEVYEHLGKISEKLGSKVEALAAYKQALQIGKETLSEPVKEEIKVAIERLSQAQN